MNITGLGNENEFYSDHYLSEIFSGDIREVLAAWQERETTAREVAKAKGESESKYLGYRSPPAQLNSLARELLQAIDDNGRQRQGKERVQAARLLQRKLLNCFELPCDPQRLLLDDGSELPLLGQLLDASGAPVLWILEALPPAGNDADQDPLTLSLGAEQFESLPTTGATATGKTGTKTSTKGNTGEDKTPDWQQLLSQQVFTQHNPPRWVLLASPRQWLLLDRAKFAQHRLLRFDWVELLTRRETEGLKAVCVLLHSDSLHNSQGQALLDTLDENAHKHAYGVSEDLKYALRECIELLGNETARQLEARAQAQKKSIYSGSEALDPAELSLEALRYMYRLLFLFYIEARPELGYAPVQSQTYLKSYSLEHLRELELVPLTSASERNGRYIHDSLQRLFALVQEGYTHTRDMLAEQSRQSGRDAFEMQALKSHLFDPNRTSNLNKVVFPNALLQQVIQLMSLSRAARGRQRRGRISYAQLGINQLGAVYEALLSYRGFFAREDLYEVKRAEDHWDPLGTGYFVNASALSQYNEDEKVFVKDASGHQQLRKHAKGSFIYRLAGRDRQKSASYYTPEVLTQSLVKYALKEVKKEQLDPLPDDKARAERLLQLTVCEPAMGSAAFLNEAINQMADLYLHYVEKATGTPIPQYEFLREKQKVKMYLADHNVFGVDLNPVAVELAEVSLWLNALSGDRFVPWFGLQLHHGNSLIGARREVFSTEQLLKGAHEPWLEIPPKRVPLDTQRADGQIWHFLLPDKGMALYKDKDVKALYPDQIKHINDWRKQFTKPFSKDEVARLERLSQRIDELWGSHAQSLATLRQRTTDPYAIYGHNGNGEATSLQFKDSAYAQELLATELENASAYRRLKLVMDYWCALWFWPISAATHLPERDEWLTDLDHLLLGDTIVTERPGQQPQLFASTNPEEGKRFVNKYGVVNFKTLFAAFPRLAQADAIAQARRFFHWELAYADIFKERGGFDLILGNPPWIKVEWSSGDVLGDFEPRFVIREMNAPILAKLREETFEHIPELKKSWIDEFELSAGTQNFLNARVNYPVLKGTQSNLFKCFLPSAWNNASKNGISGFLHPEGVYDDPKGGLLRQALYPRLRYHFQFSNQRGLFTEVDAKDKFGANVYGPERKTEFLQICNLYDPATIDHSLAHDGKGLVPGMKTDQGGWDTAGHADRLLTLTEQELSLFAKLYDAPGTPALAARIPTIHTNAFILMLGKFEGWAQRLHHLHGQYHVLELWHETDARKKGVIRESEGHPHQLEQVVMAGPTFHIGQPYFKAETSNGDMQNIECEFITDDFLPRSRYEPIPDQGANTYESYWSKLPKVPWTNKTHLDYYRMIWRRQLRHDNERSFMTCLIPPRISHVNTRLSASFSDTRHLVMFAASCASIVFDSYLRTTNRSDLYESTLKSFPVLNWDNRIAARYLSLNCLTSHYASLWQACWSAHYQHQQWSITTDESHPSASIMRKAFFPSLTPEWQRNCALRCEYTRRQALLEIDVLVAQTLALTLDELFTIYHVQFPVMHQYEGDTWYDQNGRMVFTAKSGMGGLPRKARLIEGTHYSLSTSTHNEHNIALGWDDIKTLTEGTVTKTFMDDTLPGGATERSIIYQAPFFKPDREQDYRIAWEFFAQTQEQDA